MILEASGGREVSPLRRVFAGFHSGTPHLEVLIGTERRGRREHLTPDTPDKLLGAPAEGEFPE